MWGFARVSKEIAEISTVTAANPLSGTVNMVMAMAKFRLLNGILLQEDVAGRPEIKSIRLVNGNCTGALIPLQSTNGVDYMPYTKPDFTSLTNFPVYATPSPATEPGVWQNPQYEPIAVMRQVLYPKENPIYRQYTLYTPEMRLDELVNKPYFEIEGIKNTIPVKYKLYLGTKPADAPETEDGYESVAWADVYNNHIVRSHIYELVLSVTPRGGLNADVRVCEWENREAGDIIFD